MDVTRVAVVGPLKIRMGNNKNWCWSFLKNPKMKTECLKIATPPHTHPIWKKEVGLGFCSPQEREYLVSNLQLCHPQESINGICKNKGVISPGRFSPCKAGSVCGPGLPDWCLPGICSFASCLQKSPDTCNQARCPPCPFYTWGVCRL